jgi:hypothetical protein
MHKRAEAIGRKLTNLQDIELESPKIEDISARNPEILVFLWAIRHKPWTVDIL